MLSSENLRRCLLVAGTVAVTLAFFGFLGLIEVVDYRALFGAQGDQFASTNLADKDLLHVHPPYLRVSGSSRGGNVAANFQIPRSERTLYQWDLRYDLHGFRNDRDLSSADTVVIGDSFVESMTSPTAQLITSLLAQLQGNVVANLGQYGYGPLEELAVLKRYGLPLRPRTVVWMFYEGNDLGDVIHYHKAWPFLNKPPQPDKPLQPPPVTVRSFAHNILAQIAHHVRALIRTQLRRASLPSGRKRAGVLTTPEGKKRTVYFLYGPGPLSPEELAALDETAVTLAAARKLCAERGCRFLVAFIPTKFRAYHEFCQFPPESECRNWGVNDMPDRIRKATGPTSSEAGYLDLTPFLADAVKKGEAPFYSDDDHWSPKGEEIAAKAIDSYLRSMAVR